MVGEGVVLRRVEHLEQGTGRVALIRLPQLVHLVEQEDGIARPGLLHSLNDAARHCAHIRAAVAANVGLVARTAQRHAHVLAAERAGNALGNRCLAHSRRTVEEQDGPAGHGARLGFPGVGDLAVFLAVPKRGRGVGGFPLQLRYGELTGRRDFSRHLLRPQLPHGEELEHAILHVLEPVVILVEDLPGARQFEVVVAARVPRQLGDPLEIGADDLRLHAFAAGTLQAPQLALHLGARLLGQQELAELLPKLADLLAGVVVAELLLNGLELLAQEHLALALTELLLNLTLDVFLGFEQADLSLHVHEHAAQALFHAERFQQPLLLGHGELDVAGHEVGEAPGVLDRIEYLMHHLFGESALLAKLGGALAGFLVKRGECRILEIQRHHLFGGHDHGREIAVLLAIVQGGGALFSLQQQLYAAEATLHLADPRNDAGAEQDIGGGLLGVVALRHGEDKPVALERRFDGAQGTGPPGGDGGGDSGKHDRPTQREDGEGLALTHGNS